MSPVEQFRCGELGFDVTAPVQKTHGLADKIIEAGSTAEPPVAAPSVPDQRGRIGHGLSGDEWTDAATHHVAVCRAAGVIGRRLVNGFVNETPRNERDGVERSVMA